jgi:DNA-binding SARP family transcriptional activator
MVAQAHSLELFLLGGFELRWGSELVMVTAGTQRLLAFLVLHDRLLPRAYVAGTLWPEVPTRRANGNLRAGLWRLPAYCRSMVDLSANHVRLGTGVNVDLRGASALAHRLLDRSRDCSEDDLSSAARLELSRDLLPTWSDDDWVVAERERFHQLRLHALEALSDWLIAAGRFGEAVDSALAAVNAEPLRESAHRVLIKAHLAEGNRWEARLQYDLYRDLMLDELGVQPSPRLRDLVFRDQVDLVTSSPSRNTMGRR